MKKSFFLPFLLLFAGTAMAQPFTMQPDIVPTELLLHPFKPEGKEKLNGRMGISEVTQVKDTLYFFAKGFSIYSPGFVGITMEDKANTVEVGLFKENWLKASRSGTTSEGHWEDKFKTEGDMGIRVIAKTKPAKYVVTVWNGAEVEVDVPNAFTTYSDKNVGGGGFFKKYWMYIAGGVVLLGLVVFFMMRKKKTVTA